MRVRSVAALATTLMLGPVSVIAAQAGPVPPKIEPEFRETVRAVASIAEAHAGDTALFRASVQPFGPYDLVVLRPSSAREVDLLRNFFLGIVGGAARIDPAPLANAWQCGPCVAARRDSLVARLPQIRTLVTRFQQLPRVTVVAPWPARGFRVGLVAYDGRVWRLDTPSPIMGFVPWRSTTLSDSGAQALHDMGMERRVVDSLVSGLREASLAAIARDSVGSIRVVLQGSIGDTYGEAVAPGVYFYVTT
jgi:hypothetical protein